MSHPNLYWRPPHILLGAVGALVILLACVGGTLLLLSKVNRHVKPAADTGSDMHAAATSADYEPRRIDGADAASRAGLAIVQTEAARYFYAHENSYAGFCSEPEIRNRLVAAVSGYYDPVNRAVYVCNDSDRSWAAAIPLATGGFACTDPVTQAETLPVNLTTQTMCHTTQ